MLNQPGVEVLYENGVAVGIKNGGRLRPMEMGTCRTGQVTLTRGEHGSYTVTSTASLQ